MDSKKFEDYFSRAKDLMESIHKDGKADRLFASGISQWDGQESARQSMGRTSYVFNRILSLVNPTVNAIKKAPPAIRVIPLGGDATADNCRTTAARIRLLEAQCNAKRARMHALGCAVTGGFGVWRTIPKQINGTWRPVTETILHPETVYPDPDCKESDFSDARMVFQEIKASRRKLAAAFPESEWSQRQNVGTEYQSASDVVDVVECWYLEDGELYRCFHAEGQLIGTDEFESPAGHLSKLPYSFVTGNWYDDQSEKWHFASVTRFAKDDQVAINVSENEWISEIMMGPKASFIGQADAVEDFEEETADLHTRSRHIMKVKDITKLMPMPKDSSAATRFSQLSQAHIQGMQEIAGVGFNQGATIDPVSGKSVQLQQSQAAISTFHYADSLNAAVEHDGWVYLDQLRVYEKDGCVRAIMHEDGEMGSAVFGDSTLIPDAIDMADGDFGIQVSTGPSYGSQLDQIQDMMTEIMKIPALAPVVPLLITLMTKRWAIPESESINQAIMTLLPQQIQMVMASRGNKDAVIAQMATQGQQMQQQLQMLQQQLQQAMSQLSENQKLMELRVMTAREDNAARIQIEQIKGERERESEANDREMEVMRINADLLKTFATQQAQLMPMAPGPIVPDVPPQFAGGMYPDQSMQILPQTF